MFIISRDRIAQKLHDVLNTEKTSYPSLDMLLVRSLGISALSTCIRKFDSVDVCLINLIGQICIYLLYRNKVTVLTLMVLELAWVLCANVPKVHTASILVGALTFMWELQYYTCGYYNMELPHPVRMFFRTFVLLGLRTVTPSATAVSATIHFVLTAITYFKFVPVSPIDILLFVIAIIIFAHFSNPQRLFAVYNLANCLFLIWMVIKTFDV